MITIVMGRPGSGKSTFLAINSNKNIKYGKKVMNKIEKEKFSKKQRDSYIAKQIKLANKKGKQVYSNVYIDGTIKLDPRTDLNYYLIENALIIIDEAGFEFNSRNWKQFGDSLYRFFTMHRHYNCDVILAVQMWDRVDLCIREVTERIVICEPTMFSSCFIRVSEVRCKIGVEEGQIKEIYEYVPWYLGGIKYIYRKPAMKLFNSYYQDTLQVKDKWNYWGK